MKDIRTIILDQSPKNVKKVMEAAEKGGCSQYLQAFASELALNTAADFQDVKGVVTEHYFCDYSNYGMMRGNSLIIIPTENIANVYRCNIMYDSYSFDNFVMAVELTNGSRLYCCSYMRGRNAENVHFNLVQCIRSKIANRNMGVQ